MYIFFAGDTVVLHVLSPQGEHLGVKWACRLEPSLIPRNIIPCAMRGCCATHKRYAVITQAMMRNTFQPPTDYAQLTRFRDTEHSRDYRWGANARRSCNRAWRKLNYATTNSVKFAYPPLNIWVGEHSSKTFE